MARILVWWNHRLKFFFKIEDKTGGVTLKGVTSAISKPASPVYLGLCIKIEDGSFEPMLIIPYSVPPEFADVMKMVPPATNTEPIEANNLTIQNEEMPPPDQN
ncbi:uncharacterized protein LOC113367350 [Ctenocephalides felis]|uniref:uncharacterized protein LOC113367350 n=1 Tax=Ctenocephalides felis TaxID=7515 RepID=UPI000E6E1949|nr:uncharacterized protein LOC113367350 [Ctenocephalides felis]